MVLVRALVIAMLVALTAVALVSPAAAQSLDLSPSGWNAGTITVGQSTTQTITLTNTGGGIVTVSSYALGPGTAASFAITSGPATPFDLAAGASAAVQVAFQPTVAGGASGSLQAVSSVGTARASLTGVGRLTALGLSATSLDLGSVAVGSTGGAALTVTNSGTSVLSITGLAAGAQSAQGIAVAGGFSIPFTLAAGASQIVQVQYTPTAAGVARGSVAIATSAGSAQIPVVALGASPDVALVPGEVAFDNVLLGVAGQQSVSLQNPGTSTLVVSDIRLAAGGSPAFAIGTAPALPLALAPGAAENVALDYTPTLVGADETRLEIVGSGGEPIASAPVGGQGVLASLRLEPTTLDLGTVSPGGTRTATFRIQNAGPASLSVTSLAMVPGSGGGFSLPSPPATPFTVAAGASATIQVRFAPTAAGTQMGAVRVDTTVGSGTVALDGAGRFALEVRYFTSVPFRLGAGLECAGCLQVRLLDGAVAPAGGLLVTATSNDPTRLLVAPASIPTAGGTPSVQVTIAAGANNATVSVQGLATGTTTVTATAAGTEASTSLPVQIETPGYALVGLGTSYAGGSADVPFTVRLGLLPSPGVNYQRARQGGPAVSVQVTSGTPTAGQLVTTGGASDSASVSIAPGRFETWTTIATGGVAFRPLAAGGSTTVTASIAGMTAAPGATQTVSVSGTTPNLSVSVSGAARLGAGLEAGNCCSVSLSAPAPAGGLAVTLTSSDASRLLIASQPVSGGGSGSLLVNVAAGASTAAFSLQGGTATGAATVTATAAGYNAGTSSTVSVETPLITLTGLATTLSAIAPNDEFQVRVGLPTTTGGTTFGAAQPLRQGSPAVTATVTTSNTAAGLLVTSGGSGDSRTIEIAPGASESPVTVAAGGVAFDPSDAGTAGTATMVAVSAPGFLASTTASQTVTLSSAAPTLSVSVTGAARLGAGLEAAACCSVTASAPAPAGGVSVTLTSSDAARLLVAPSPIPGSGGGGSIVVVIPAGATSVAFSLQGGTATGDATVAASAAGHTGGTSAAVSVETPVLTLANLASAQTTTGPNDDFQVRVGLPTTAGGNVFGTAQPVRQGGGAVTATVTNSSSAAGTLVTSAGSGDVRTVQITAGASESAATVAAGGVAFDPSNGASGGETTTVAATIPGVAPSTTSSQVVTLSVAPSFVLEVRYFTSVPFRIGAGLECNGCLQVRLLNGAVAPAGGLAVTVTSNDPGILWVAPSPIPPAGGGPSTIVTIAAGASSASVSPQGREGVTGTTTVTATAPNSTPSTSQPVQVETAGYVIMGLGASYAGGGPDVPFTVRVGLLPNPGTNYQRVRTGGPGLGVGVTSDNGSAGQLVTTSGASTNVTVTLPAGLFETRTTVAAGGVAFRPMPAGGAATVTSSITGLTAASGASRTVNVSPAAPTLGVSVGGATRIGAGLEVGSCCAVSVNTPAPAGGLAVTLTSSDASRLLVAAAPIPGGGGSGAVIVTIPDGGTSAPFSLQGGTATGAATITATAAGYAPGVSPSVAVETPLVTLINLANAQSATGPNDEFQVRIGLASAPGGSTFGAAQALRQGGPAATATVTSSSPAAGTLVTSAGSGDSRTVQIAPGQSDSPATVAAGGVAFDPNDGGDGSETTTVAASIPGFTASTTASVAVSLSGLRMEFFFHHPGSALAKLGAGLQVAGGMFVRLLDGAVAPPGGLTVTVSSDFAGLLVGNTGFPVTGLPSRQFTIPAGGTQVALSIQGVEDTLGVGRLTATAPGAQMAVSEPIHIVQPIITIQSMPVTIAAGAADQFFLLVVGVALDNGLLAQQQVRHCTCNPEHPYTATISSSNGAVAQIMSAANMVELQRAPSVTGQWQQGHTFTEPEMFPVNHIAVALDPLAPGTTDVTVSMPPFITSPLEGTRSVTVTP